MSKAKEIVGLDCEASAAMGIHLLLHGRVGEMCELQTAALDWSDMEGVHDMRVASRRLRSALRDFSSFLNQRKIERANTGIRQIADTLGAVRDNDVAIAALEKLASEAPAEAKPGIELFVAKRRERRENDRSALIDAIADDRLRKLRAEFDAALEAALESSRKGQKKGAKNHVEISFRVAGLKILKARIEELRDSSASLYEPFNSKPLHRMRIAAKRLRYAIELFAQCWRKQLDPFAKDVAAMQSSLGELHDCDMWINEFGSLLKKQDPGKPGTNEHEAKRAAAIWLLSHFTKRRIQHYRNALSRWHTWEGNDFFARLQSCMNDNFSDTLPAKSLEPSHTPFVLHRVPKRAADPRT